MKWLKLSRQSKEYDKFYTEYSGNELIVGRVDVRFEQSEGEVVDFALSLKYVKMEKEYEVYRVDTAPHRDNPHEHLLWRSEEEEVRPIQGSQWKDYNQLLNQSLDFIDDNYLKLIKIYKRRKGV